MAPSPIRSTTLLAVGALSPAPWNANRVSPATMRKLRASIARFGFVENLVVRPYGGRGKYEVISGNHRLELLREMGVEKAPAVVVKLSDGEARVLAQAMNRTRGVDDPKLYAKLLDEILTEMTVQSAVEVLPETESSIDRALRGYRLPDPGVDEVQQPPAKAKSKPGQIYALGPHRLMCGDATDPKQVGKLLAGDQVDLLATDPPYGVSVDHTWRDGKRQPIGAARTATVANDDRWVWTEAYRLAGAPVAYVWHGAMHAGDVALNLEAAGYEVRQQIVWVKSVLVLGRANYHWKHEPCWYAVRKGGTANWLGDRSQTTVWEHASPIGIFGRTGGDQDVATPHPTQKPVALYEIPILNHVALGGTVYDPFAGSGAALIAAERTGRRALLMELEPAWCDVIRARYQTFVRGRSA